MATWLRRSPFCIHISSDITNDPKNYFGSNVKFFSGQREVHGAYNRIENYTIGGHTLDFDLWSSVPIH